MRRKIIYGILILIMLFSIGCSKKGDSIENEEDIFPVPQAQYDNSNFGVYRGVLVGSKGVVTVNLNNNNKIIAIVKMDGQGMELHSSQTIQQNMPVTLNFSNSAMSFTFSCDATGANPTVSNIVFSGHPNSKIVLMKSLSNMWVDIFDCTYKENISGGESGVFMLVMLQSVKGLGSESSFQNVFDITGTQSGGHVSCTATLSGGATNISGVVSSDVSSISGSFSNSHGTGTWQGSRYVD